METKDQRQPPNPHGGQIKCQSTHHSSQGDRAYMEDRLQISYQEDEVSSNTDDNSVSAAAATYFGVFDGHGGGEAAEYTKNYLLDHISSRKEFSRDENNDELILKAMKDGFLSLHRAMLKERETWPKMRGGHLSNAGTTASIALFKNGKLYVAHVGDSSVVLGYQEEPNSSWKARQLTKDHKLDCPVELKRIEASGGAVGSAKGVSRVIWNRPRSVSSCPITRSIPVDSIPYLNIPRSLGDFWSFNPEKEAYVISPEPDTMVVTLEPGVHKCVILGSDGLWNVVKPQKAVDLVFSNSGNPSVNLVNQAFGSVAKEEGSS